MIFKNIQSNSHHVIKKNKKNWTLKTLEITVGFNIVGTALSFSFHLYENPVLKCVFTPTCGKMN